MMGVVQLGNNKNDASGNTGTGANAAVVAKVVLVKLALIKFCAMSQVCFGYAKDFFMMITYGKPLLNLIV